MIGLRALRARGRITGRPFGEVSIMRRRNFVAASAAVLAALPAATGNAQSKVTVIYVGGWDCPPCNVWKKDDKPGWLASDLIKKVNYVQVESPRLKEAYQDKYWPPELLPIRDKLPLKSNTPRFIVVREGKIVANEWGTDNKGSTAWARALPAIKKAVGA